MHQICRFVSAVGTLIFVDETIILIILYVTTGYSFYIELMNKETCYIVRNCVNGLYISLYHDYQHGNPF
jgi:hypothetical protein